MSQRTWPLPETESSNKQVGVKVTNLNKWKNRRPGRRPIGGLLGCYMFFGLLASLLAGCEAPLVLEGVELENNKTILRFDMFQSAAHHGDRVVVVSSTGAALVSEDSGTSWQRFDLPDRPALIGVTACPSGDFYALDNLHQVWNLPAGSKDWGVTVLDTMEATLSIYCAPDNSLWVTASFSMLYSSRDNASSWQEYTLDEDLQFTQVQFVDSQTGFAVGEFGTVLITTDGGNSWERGGDIPNEFYPMAAHFRDQQSGWVGGLGGVIWSTADGGQTWERQQSAASSPIYGINATETRVFAVGGSGTLLEYTAGEWQFLKGAPPVPSYLRGLDILDNDSLLVAGGAGTVATIPLIPGS